MRAYSQKHDCFIGLFLTKAEFTFLNIAAFLADNKNDSKVPVNTSASATDQIQFSTDVSQKFRVVIWIFQDPVDSPFNRLPYG